jgi:hypothetical protein
MNTNTERTIKMTPEIAAILKEIHIKAGSPASGPIFQGIDLAEFRAAFKRICQKAGVTQTMSIKALKKVYFQMDFTAAVKSEITAFLESLQEIGMVFRLASNDDNEVLELFVDHCESSIVMNPRFRVEIYGGSEDITILTMDPVTEPTLERSYTPECTWHSLSRQSFSAIAGGIQFFETLCGDNPRCQPLVASNSSN